MMHWLQWLVLLPSAASATLNLGQYRPEAARTVFADRSSTAEALARRQQKQPKFLTDKTREFVVNGTGIPNVDFDVGESYAGLLPIGSNNDTSQQLYFWFFPSESEQASKEILIWLTGGPGCSSTGELLAENGPMLWQPGMFKPIKNKWSWHRITNVVWVDQPVGAGFSIGTPTARDETDVASQFLGFWKNFVDAFAMQGFEVYVTGSSYSGMYCPYIASAMLDQNDKTYFNVAGMQIFDGVYAVDAITEQIPLPTFVDRWESVFAFNDSMRGALKDANSKCGYEDYMRKYLVYPPAGQQPSMPAGTDEAGRTRPECDVWSMTYLATAELNPCFSVYTITDLCPLKYDPLGFSVGTFYSPDGSGPVYFNRTEVKRAINAPDKDWVFCTNNPVFINGTDNSVLSGPGSQPVLPNVIDGTQNVILAHGVRDFVLIDDGTLLTIQNLTWGGKMGFQARPTAPLYAPLHDNADPETLAGAGVVGTVHSERGLTYLAVASAGHFVSADAPAVAFRSVEVLVGRREGFESSAPFTIDGNSSSSVSTGDVGNGTVVMFPQSVMQESGRLLNSPLPVMSGGLAMRESRALHVPVVPIVFALAFGAGTLVGSPW